MAILSDLLRRFGSKQTQPSQPTTQVRNDLGFGSSGSTTAMLPPPPPAPPEPLMSVAPPKPMISVAPAPLPPPKPSLIKRLAKSVAPDSYENVKAGVNSPTAMGSLKAGAKLAFNLPKELVVQPAARFATQLGQEVVTGGQAETWTPKSKLAQTLLGKEEVKPIGEETGDLVRTGYELSRKYNAGRLDPNDPSSKFLAGSMTPFFALAAGGIKALDVEPGVGSGGKKAAKKLLQEGAEKLAKESLEKAGKEVSEQVVKQTSEELMSKAPQLVEALASKADKTVKPALREVYQLEKPWAGVEGDVFVRIQDPVTRKTRNVRVDELEKQGMKIVPRPESELPQKTLSQTVPLEKTETPALRGELSQPPQPGLSTIPDSPERIARDSLSYTDNVPQPKESYNTKYLGGLDPEDAPAEIQKEGRDMLQSIAAKSKQEATGKPLTFKEIQARAEESSAVLDDLTSREETKDVAAQMLNLRREIAADIQSGNMNADFISKLMKDQAAAADAARILNSRKIMAEPAERTAIEEMIKKLRKDGEDVNKILETAKKYDLNDPEQQVKFYRELSKPGYGDWIDVLRYNSMLSSPLTHVINAASNLTGSAVVAPAEKALVGALDFARSAITGKPREAFVGEAPAYLKGYVKSLGEATNKFWDTLSGKNLMETPDVRNLPLTEAGTAARVGENVLKAPMKLLESMDQFFMTLAKGGEMGSLTYRAGKGVTVKNMEKEAKQKAVYRLFRSDIKGKEQGMVLDAIDEVTGSLLKLTQSQNPIARTITRFTLPFIKTPMNIFKQGIEYSPLGFSTIYKAKNKQEQLAKAIMGTGTMLGIATLLGDERLTGAAPTNKEDYDRWKAAGIQPYSVKIGDKWYSYQKLHPAMAYNFALVTSLDQALNNGKITDDTFMKVLRAFGNQAAFLADQSYMKSIGELNQGLSGNPEKLASFVSNYPEQLVPFRAMLGWITRATDDVERQIDPNATQMEKIMQEFFTQIPWKADELQERLNPKTGEAIKRPNKIFNAFSPVRVTSETPEAAQMSKEIQSRRKYQDLADEDRKIGIERKRKALQLYQELKNMEPGEANGRAQALQKEDPELFQRLADVVKSVKSRADTDMAELRKLNVNTDSRAKAVWRNLQQLETREEKNGYLKELYDAKVINPTILKQIQEIKEAEEKAKAPQP